MEWTKKSVEALIDAWGNEPCLFHVKHESYYNKRARKEALKRLVERVKTFRGPTTPVEVQVKMKSLRTTYVHELSKTVKSQRSGAGLLDVYQPIVWYFRHLTFLKDHVQPRKTIVNFQESIIDVGESPRDLQLASGSQLLDPDFQESDGILSAEASLEMSLPVSPTASTSGSSKGRPQKWRKVEEEDDILKKAHAVLEQVSSKPVTEWDAFGQYVAATLKGVTDRKLQLRAKKGILNILMDVEEEDLENKFLFSNESVFIYMHYIFALTSRTLILM